MTDHPIPDDLVAIARRIHMTQLRLYTLTERKPVDGPSPVDP